MGINNGKWGQVPVALVVVRQGYEITEEELIEFCKEQLAGFKVPTQIKIAPMLPLTGAGKLNRAALKEMFI